jgi:hypothetical protein
MNYQAIAQRIKIIVKDEGGQIRFAKAVGYNQAVISRVINHKKDPSDDLIKAIIIKLKYSPNWLFIGEGEKKADRQKDNLVTDLKTIRIELDLARAKVNSYEYEVQQLRKK